MGYSCGQANFSGPVASLSLTRVPWELYCNYAQNKLMCLWGSLGRPYLTTLNWFWLLFPQSQLFFSPEWDKFYPDNFNIFELIIAE
jgi:hypothetical protein